MLSRVVVCDGYSRSILAKQRNGITQVLLCMLQTLHQNVPGMSTCMYRLDLEAGYIFFKSFSVELISF